LLHLSNPSCSVRVAFAGYAVSYIPSPRTRFSRAQSVGSEEARRNASLRPPLKLDMQFSSIQLSRRCSFPRCKQRNQINLPRLSPISEVGFIEYRFKNWLINEWSFYASVGLSRSASLLGWRCTGFSLMELILLYTFTHWFSFSSQPPSPAHSAADYSVTRLSPRFLVLFGCPTTDRAPLATSLPLIGLLPAEPPADPVSSPGVTRYSSVPCHPQTPWCGG